MVGDINYRRGLMLLAPSRQQSAALEMGRLVKLDWINIDHVRSWKAACDNRHDKTINCTSSFFLFSSRPIFLIDTWKHCLVPAGATKSYIALSYVWGSRPFFKTLKSTLPSLLLPGALQRRLDSLPIPRTILDTIGLVKALGDHYLWVDALCIPQDDEDVKHAQICNMSAIYANACLTIVAAQGADAEFGLRGLQGISQKRHYHQEIFDFAPDLKVVLRSRRTQLENLRRSPWSKRAWTFQEELFSQRMLVFMSNSVFWHCPHATWEEEMEPVHDVVDRYFSSMDESRLLLRYNVPHMGHFGGLVNEYNEREFTFPEDIVDAFAGTSTLLSPIFLGGFNCGIPLAFFDIALLWQPNGKLERRIAVKKISNPCLPTWSWMGWAGAIQRYPFYKGFDAFKSQPNGYINSDEAVIPTTQWYKHTTIDRTESVPIYATWYTYREKFLDKEGTLPLGWTRVNHVPAIIPRSDLPVGFSIKQPRWYYTHPQFPESKFWYPIPFLAAGDSVKLEASTPYISCRTRRAWLYEGGCYIAAEGYECVTLRDSVSAWAGVIRRHEDSGDVSFVGTENVLKGKSLEADSSSNATSEGYDDPETDSKSDLDADTVLTEDPN